MFFWRHREKTPLERIREELKQKGKNPQAGLAPISLKEQGLLEEIRKETAKHNLNNVTRTKAYLDYYLRYPEIQWAFLGHMVSRNGGYSMTDLQGELLTRLLSKKERTWFFSFLERGNWLIFQDVYPQFLLYQESLRRGKKLFYLLPHLQVSSFMETIWNHFWVEQDRYIHCIALVINEQSYLEKRVIQNPVYQKEVLGKFEFFLQDVLSFNHILFPYDNKGLKGLTLHQFQSLHERILLGKRLYAVLFKNKDIHRQMLAWAKSHPHTGSRKDYWPHLFNSVKEGVPGIFYPLRLKSCRLRKGASRFYSPKLENAWKNVSQPEAEAGDWFQDDLVADYLEDDIEMIDGEIKDEYCKTLERLEIAALAKKTILF
ncbi:DUF2515 domain-containing protein [Bacillus tuaregi]|uniref:DUF2515 domain-containing protein n=1 Tax=Bacillus tuaregi TaxID=1816695 RepID=UPI0008F8DDEE|nr:DUF2515 domain-containing protein [Bacillus tuaregi]